MRPLGVAHVILSFGVGGQERIVVDLVRAQERLGHRVAAVALSDQEEGDLTAALAEAGARVERIPKRPGFDPTLYPRLALLFRRLQADLVHTHNPMPLIYGAPAARAAGARVVHTKHGEHRDSRTRMALRRGAGRLTGAFVAVSETTADFARRHGECAPEKLRIIQNGTDLERFGPDPEARREVRAELGIPEEAWVVGSVGRFVPEKDQGLLLAAAEPHLGERFQLLFAGDGPRLEEIRRRAERSPGRRYIHLLGRRDDVPALLAAMDTFALSSATEGLPIVLIEAMASGLPIVSTSVGGIPGVIRAGETGWLVPPGDPGPLRAALAEAAGDRREAASRGRRARQHALSELSAERMSREYLSLYAQVLRK